MRTIIKVICTCLLSICLIGCHSSNGLSAFVVPEQFDESKQYEITFWAKNDTNKTQVDIYKNAITEFEKIYPNITVNLRLYTDYGKIYNDVITNISTGTTPNVCITYPDHIATYMSGSNTVVSLDELMDDEKYGLGGSEIKFDSVSKEEIVTEYLQEGVIQDTQYALPFMRSTEALYVNQTYVEKLGYTLPDVITWDFMFEVGEAALQKNTDGTYFVNDQSVLIPIIYKSTDNMLIQMLEQLDAPYSNELGEIDLFNETTSKVLNQIQTHAQTGAFSTFKLSGYPANFLNAGQCIFAIDSTAGSTWMGSQAPLSDIAEETKVDFETKVLAVPQYDTENIKMISQGPSICIFNKSSSDEVLASWIFAQYLLTNDVQIAYSQTEGYVPVTSKAQNDSSYLAYLDDPTSYDVKIQATKLLLENTENTFVTAVFNGSTSLRNAAGQLIEDTVKAIKRNQKIDETYYAQLYENTASLYRLDQIQNLNAMGNKRELGELPMGSKILIGTLFVAWIFIIFIMWKRGKSA